MEKDLELFEPDLLLGGDLDLKMEYIKYRMEIIAGLYISSLGKNIASANPIREIYAELRTICKNGTQMLYFKKTIEQFVLRIFTINQAYEIDKNFNLELKPNIKEILENPSFYMESRAEFLYSIFNNEIFKSSRAGGLCKIYLFDALYIFSKSPIAYEYGNQFFNSLDFQNKEEIQSMKFMDKLRLMNFEDMDEELYKIRIKFLWNRLKDWNAIYAFETTDIGYFDDIEKAFELDLFQNYELLENNPILELQFRSKFEELMISSLICKMDNKIKKDVKNRGDILISKVSSKFERDLNSSLKGFRVLPNEFYYMDVDFIDRERLKMDLILKKDCTDEEILRDNFYDFLKEIKYLKLEKLKKINKKRELERETYSENCNLEF